MESGLNASHTIPPSDIPTASAAPGRVSALDGLRAVAVAGVLLFHADVPWMPGGFLGVDVFFTLSGFLITGILLKEFQREYRIRLLNFYQRRAKRLFPALWALLVAVVLAARWVYTDAAPQLRGDVPAGLLYVSNWWYSLGSESYFEATGRPALLQHLWSLAIEEQFYLVWPVVVWAVLNRWGARALGVVSIFLALAVTGTMGLLAYWGDVPNSTDPTALYFGTHTHTMGLLLGAALAVVWRPSSSLARFATTGLTALGAAGLAAIVWSFISVTEQSGFLYRGGFLAISAAVCAVLMAASTPGCALANFLGAAPLRAVGRLSYGLYLWHFPIAAVTRPVLDVPVDGWQLAVLRLTLTFAAATVSYFFIERPIHEGGVLERWGQQLSTAHWREASLWAALRTRQVLAMLATASVTGAATFALCTIPPRDAAEAIPADVARSLGLDKGGPTRILIGAKRQKKANLSDEAIVAGTAALVGTGEASLTPATHEPDGAGDEEFALVEGPLTAVGDSVLLGARLELQQMISNTEVDAEIGRQAAQMVERLTALKAGDQLSERVLLHFGSNGVIKESQLRALLDLVTGHRVIIVNTHVPRKWMQPNNELIARLLLEYPNAVLADWANASESHPEFFASDGTHLTVSGQRAYVAEILRVGQFKDRMPSVEIVQANLRVSGKEEFLVSASAPALNRKSEQPGELLHFRQPIAPDSYWVEMARCESGGRWNSSKDGTGGLAIDENAWKTWGGAQFAQTPDEATREQQIIVANRISTQGWKPADGEFVSPSGFDQWGCAATVRPAALLSFDPEVVITQTFTRSSPARYVRDLQAIIGMPRDGHYGRLTAKVHAKALVALNLHR